MSTQGSHPDRSGDELPQGLLDDLHALYGRSVHVPSSLDQRILSVARVRLLKAKPRETRPMTIAWRAPIRWGAGLAAAALVVLAIRLALWDRTPDQQPTPTLATRTEAANREDINRDGRVDILDAYLLARRVKLTGKLQQDWDFNADGRVDESDARLIARTAVRLEGGPVQ